MGSEGMESHYTLAKKDVLRFVGLLLLIGALIGIGIGVAAFSRQQTITQQVTVTSRITSTIQLPGGTGLIEYAFSPGRKCADVVIKWIQRANSTIHILIYSFTLDNVRDALIQAKNRGVDVKIVMEKENWNGTGSEYTTLKNAGIAIRLDSNHALMHDKVAIIDGHIVLTGSFNWSAAGNEDNNENLVVLESQAWSAAFEIQFQQIYSIAT